VTLITAHITALCSRLRAAMRGFYLDLGIGCETIAILAMAAAIAILKVIQ
jgi:hypothetical protein